jgi:hypothetical protein
MSGAIAIDDEAIDAVTDGVCDGIAGAVQALIGQKHGDLAGQHFHRRSPAWNVVRAAVSDYLALEERHLEAEAEAIKETP